MSNGDRPVRACRVRDVGFGGVFVLAEGPIRAGDHVALELAPALVPRRRSVRAKGRVVRVEPGRGIAIEFTDMTLESFDFLDRLLHLGPRSRDRVRRAEAVRAGPPHQPRFR